MAQPASCHPSCSSDPSSLAPRLLDRGAAYWQSSGHWNVRRLDREKQTHKLRWNDVFHNLIALTTWKLFSLIILVIVTNWIVFAVAFLQVGNRCGLKDREDSNWNFISALYLSIETVQTIGYGVPDNYFNGCHEGIFLLGICSLSSTLLYSVVISLLYARISRGTQRASSVCFSRYAVITEINGNWYFMFQVCDFRKHQLCEAHIRLYGTRHSDTPSELAYQTQAMRLNHPDDELGGMLLLALPQVVCHRIDDWSPLCPRNVGQSRSPSKAAHVPRRSADTENGSMEDCTGIAHAPALTKQDIQFHMQSGAYEVLCLLEGIDPATSNTLQARHSYTCDEIVYNANFVECTTRGSDGVCEVHFEAFHTVVQEGS